VRSTAPERGNAPPRGSAAGGVAASSCDRLGDRLGTAHRPDERRAVLLEPQRWKLRAPSPSDGIEARE
jgi:hypothetical protein